MLAWEPVMSEFFPVVEKSIADLREALDNGEVTCVELVRSYLHRIEVRPRGNSSEFCR